MADEREPTRLHPDDLKALVEALNSGPVRLPPAPSDVPSGIDARVISEAVRAIVGEKIAGFLTREQINDLVDDRLGRIGLRMDEAHIEDTGDAIRGAMKWHRLTSKLWIAGAVGVASSLVAYITGKLGLPQGVR